ncbi:MAG: MoxR family ATPase [Chloroflexi bacterium]|nr:MoxR family ATPase [Chloroflexota bacterium]
MNSIDELQQALQAHSYIADRSLATAVYLALKLERPLFLEGEPGVGKTEIAKVLAAVLETDLIRLQCYEGLDISHAVYEWNYTRQLLHIRLLEARGAQTSEAELFGAEFLLARPLLQAIDPQRSQPPVLLIDEIDRSDDEFEAFLLEILSDYQITIPEIGPIRARHKPIVILTSNRTREIHDALKRRCLYAWIEYPDFEKEYQIVRAKLPHAPAQLAQQVTRFIQELRQADLYKIPGVAETLDWTAALVALDQHTLTLEIVQDTLGVILKYQDDFATIHKNLNTILEKASS